MLKLCWLIPFVSKLGGLSRESDRLLVGKILPKQIDAQVRTDFSDMSYDELNAYIENQMREMGWVPGPNGRRLVEPPKLALRHSGGLELAAEAVMRHNGLARVLSK